METKKREAEFLAVGKACKAIFCLTLEREHATEKESARSSERERERKRASERAREREREMVGERERASERDRDREGSRLVGVEVIREQRSEFHMACQKNETRSYVLCLTVKPRYKIKSLQTQQAAPPSAPN